MANPKYKPYNQEQSLLITFDSEEFIPANSFARHINKVFENHINIQAFEQKIMNGTEKGGASAYNIRMMLKLIFYSYCMGVYYSRDIENKCLTDIYYIYLTGYTKTDHSTICRFINKYQEEIIDVFSQVVYIMEESGYIDKNIIAIDGTKIKANANSRFSGTLKDYENKKEQLQERIKYLIEQHSEADNKEERDQIIKKQKASEKWQEKIDNFFKEITKKEQEAKVTNEKKIAGKNPRPPRYNLTDPDCRIMKNDKNGTFPGYNAQTAVEAKNHIVINCKVYNAASESVLFQDIVEETKEHINLKGRNKTKLLADAGYYNAENIVYIEREKINAYIPEGRDDAHGKDRKNKFKKIGSEMCKKQKRKGEPHLICPGKHRMKFRYIKTDRGEQYYVFRPDHDRCLKCRHYSNCKGYLKHPTVKNFVVSKIIFDNLETIKSMKKKLQSKKGRKIYNKRIGIVEHPFGEIKEYKNFQRFSYRGEVKVNMQWSLVCTAYNLRKWHRIINRN